MEIGEILGDALVYPFHNIKALVLYLILGIILGIAIIGTLVSVSAGVAIENIWAVIGSGVIGIIISLFIVFLINGYQLDIVKYGIQRSASAPDIDFIRQFINGVKLFAVQIVYMLIPIILSSILAIIFQHWLSGIISFIVSIIFSLALVMAQCRLAKTEDIGDALSIGEAIGDISRVGIVKLILVIIIIAIISLILYSIAILIAKWNATVGGILFGIIVVYVLFFNGRVLGLLYSDV